MEAVDTGHDHDEHVVVFRMVYDVDPKFFTALETMPILMYDGEFDAEII